MKKSIVILIACLLLIVGCAQEQAPPEDTESKEPAPMPPEPAPPPPPEPEPEPVDKLSKAEEALGIKIVDPSSRKAITLNEFDTRRTSRDRGELRWVNITIRNVGDKEISPQIILWFRTTDYEKPDKVVREKVIDFPRLAPNRELTKKYPLTLRYDKIDEVKDIELRLYDISVGPKKKLGETKQSFNPTEEFPTMEIRW